MPDEAEIDAILAELRAIIAEEERDETPVKPQRDPLLDAYLNAMVDP